MNQKLNFHFTSQLVTAQSLVFSTSMAAAEMILQHHYRLSSVNFTFHEFRHLLSFAVYKIIPVSGPVYVWEVLKCLLATTCARQLTYK